MLLRVTSEPLQPGFPLHIRAQSKGKEKSGWGEATNNCRVPDSLLSPPLGHWVAMHAQLQTAVIYVIGQPGSFVWSKDPFTLVSIKPATQAISGISGLSHG